jgi:hypothetical protein
MNLKENIKLILQEESNNKINLVKNLIYKLYDEVSFIEVIPENKKNGFKKPLIKVYFDNDSNAANEESYFAHEIYRTVYDYTGIVLFPYWKTDWADIADFFLDAKRTK